MCENTKQLSLSVPRFHDDYWSTAPIEFPSFPMKVPQRSVKPHNGKNMGQLCGTTMWRMCILRAPEWFRKPPPVDRLESTVAICSLESLSIMPSHHTGRPWFNCSFWPWIPRCHGKQRGRWGDLAKPSWNLLMWQFFGILQANKSTFLWGTQTSTLTWPATMPQKRQKYQESDWTSQ